MIKLWLIIAVTGLLSVAHAGDLIYKSGFEYTALVSGSTSGLTSNTLVLKLQSGAFDENLNIAADGTFVFFADVPVGDSWTVSTVQLPNSPQQQSCVLNNESGTMSGSGADTLTVTCDNTAWNWDEMNWDEGGWN